MKEANEIVEAILKAEKIVITSHRSPDGDSIGSSLGLYNFIAALDKKAVVCHPDACPAFIEWAKNGVEIIDFEEKPIVRSHINAGVYVLQPSTIDLIKKSEKLDMPTLFQRIKKKNLKTIVYPVHEPWLDIGRPEDYYKAK